MATAAAIIAESATGCAVKVPNVINRNNVEGLGSFAGEFKENLNKIETACFNNVIAFQPGSEQIYYYADANNKPAQYAFCNGKGGSYAVGYMDTKGQVDIMRPLLKVTEGDVTEYGYVVGEKSKAIYIIKGENAWLIAPDGSSVAVSGEARTSMDQLIKTVTGASEAAALGMAEATRPVVADDFMPTVEYTPTAAATETPKPTATPEGVDYSQAFFNPQNEADFAKVIESPSPIDNPAEFAKWQDGYLAAVEEKLKTYTGPRVNSIKHSTVSFESNSFVFEFNEWPVIAAYKFKWEGKEMITKTLVIEDEQGNLTPVSITYTTPDSPVFDQNEGWTTPSGKPLFLEFSHAWGVDVKKLTTDKFAEEFLLENNPDFDAQLRVLRGKGDDADRKIMAQSRFLWARYDNYFGPPIK